MLQSAKISTVGGGKPIIHGRYGANGVLQACELGVFNELQKTWKPLVPVIYGGLFFCENCECISRPLRTANRLSAGARCSNAKYVTNTNPIKRYGFGPTHLQRHGNAVEAQAKAAQGRHRPHDHPDGPVRGEERRQAGREEPRQDGVDYAEAERDGADDLDHANSRLQQTKKDTTKKKHGGERERERERDR